MFFKQYPQYRIDVLHCNPTGDWDIGGFTADAGLTGRNLWIIMGQEFRLVVERLVVKRCNKG